MTDRLREEILVLRVQAGDDAAFAELFSEFEQRVSLYVRRVMGDTSDVEDVLQQVWLDVYRKIPKLRQPRAFRAWLYRIARDTAYGFYRKNKVVPAECVVREVADDTTDEPSFSTKDIERIRRCLQRVSRDHRDVLMLRFLEEMSYEEIATALRCKLGTVRSRIYYAKRALRREMEELENDERQGNR